MDYGRMLQMGTLDELLDRTRTELCIKVGSLAPAVVTQLRERALVQTAEDGSNRIVIRERTESHQQVPPRALRSVLDLLAEANVALLGIETNETSLETLFLQLTGRKLRD